MRNFTDKELSIIYSVKKWNILKHFLETYNKNLNIT